MKLRKKLLIAFLTICSVCATVAITACKESDSSNNSSISTETEVLTLNVTKKKLTLGDTFALIASYDKKVGQSLNWESSNPTVATVRNGVISAMTEGETIITVTYGALSATCEVTVTTNGILPTLSFDYDTDDVRVDMQGALNLAAGISFNGKKVSDGTITYESSNKSVGTISEDGTFTPLAKGTTEIKVVGAWRGIASAQLEKTFTVTVVSYRAIIVNGGEVSALALSPVETLGGQTYEKSKTLTIEAHEDSNRNKEYTVELLNNEDGAVVWNEQTKTVTAIKHGTAELKISYISEDSTEFSVSIPIEVFRPIANYAETIKLFSAMDGELPVKTIFGRQTEIVYAEQEGNKNIRVEDGNVLDVKLTNDDAVSNEIITVYDELVGYRLRLEAYTKVIYDAEDLLVFDQGTDTTAFRKITGYFVLGANVVDTEYVYNQTPISSIYQTTGWHEYGFGGTFDGRGYFLTYTCSMGLFNQFLPGAVVKNVAFNDITLVESASNGSVLGNGANFGTFNAYNTVETTVSNVYVSVNDSWFDKKWVAERDSATNQPSLYSNYTGILVSNCSAVDYKNVLVEIDAPDEYEFAPDLFSNGFYSKNGKHLAGFENVYVVGESTQGTTEHDTTGFYSYFAKAENKANPPDSVGFYADRNALKTAVTDLNTKFTGECWTLKDGVPVWTTLVDNSIKLEENIVFSSWTGYGADENDQKIVSGQIQGEIQGVYLSTDILRENNLYDADSGKINIVHISNEVLYQNVLIVTDQNEYRATLEVYTRVLTTVDELKTFHQEIDSAKVVSGSYALGANIVDTTGFVFNPKVLSSLYGKDEDWFRYGFEGTFDGKGYYMTLTLGEGGLFNQLLVGAVVKNMALIDTTLAADAPKGVALANGSNLYSLSVELRKPGQPLVEVSDVYISINETWFDKKWVMSRDPATNMPSAYTNYTGILISDCASVNYKNVLVEIETPDEYEFAPDLLQKSLYSATTTAGFENVYVISESTQGTTEHNTTGLYSYWASEAAKSYTLEGVSLYTDYTAFKADVTNANDIFTSDCWLVVDGVPTWLKYNASNV